MSPAVGDMHAGCSVECLAMFGDVLRPFTETDDQEKDNECGTVLKVRMRNSTANQPITWLVCSDSRRADLSQIVTYNGQTSSASVQMSALFLRIANFLDLQEASSGRKSFCWLFG
jgi:hypothetical protein